MTRLSIIAAVFGLVGPTLSLASGCADDASKTDAGEGGASGGGAVSVGGGDTVGGARASGGAASGAGAVSTQPSSVPGAAGCGNLMTDVLNCGACGHSCKGFACARGECPPVHGLCFEGMDEFYTCAEYCESVGETCTPRGCGTGVTWERYTDVSACRLGQTAEEQSDEIDCDALLPVSDAGPQYFHCCCSDTI